MLAGIYRGQRETGALNIQSSGIQSSGVQSTLNKPKTLIAKNNITPEEGGKDISNLYPTPAANHPMASLLGAAQ